MVVSESQLGAIKSDLQNPSIYAFLIGGSHFKNNQIIPMSDGEQADEIYWELIDNVNQTAAVPTETVDIRSKLLKSKEEYEEKPEIEPFIIASLVWDELTSNIEKINKPSSKFHSFAQTICIGVLVILWEQTKLTIIAQFIILQLLSMLLTLLLIASKHLPVSVNSEVSGC